MIIQVDRLKIGDTVAYGKYTNTYTGRNRPDFTFSRVARINAKSVTLADGTVIFFNGRVKGNPKVSLHNPDRVRKRVKEYAEEQIKREKIDKIQLLLQKIEHRVPRIDAIEQQTLDDIITRLGPIATLE